MFHLLEVSINHHIVTTVNWWLHTIVDMLFGVLLSVALVHVSFIFAVGFASCILYARQVWLTFVHSVYNLT